MTRLWAWNFSGAGLDPVDDVTGNGNDFTPTAPTLRTAPGGGYTYGGTRPNTIGLTQSVAGIQAGPPVAGLQPVARTVCGWAVIVPSGVFWFMEFRRSAEDTGVQGWLNLSGTLRLRLKDPANTVFESGTITPVGAYRFYALTHDGTVLKAYQSDAGGALLQIGADVPMASPVWTADNFRVLDNSGPGVTLSDWQSFDTALTVAELEAVMLTPVEAEGNVTIVDPVSETDTALPPVRSRERPADIATEIDTALPPVRARSRTITVATETDTALPPSRIRVRSATTALETDAALPAREDGPVPDFECPSEWTNDCGCPDAHNSCWPEPIVNCCPELQVTDDTTPEQLVIIEQSKRIAVSLLDSFTAHQFGLCPRIVRPCRDNCAQPVNTEWVDGQLRPTLYGGVWINDVCGKCKTGCSCSTVCEVTLPGPVYSITEVVLDGIVLSPLDYRVDNRRKLVAQGDFCWPTCQDMSKPANMPGTWTVEYLRGLPVPEAGRWASGLLACEFVKACGPDAGECRLPDNVKSIAREGVTMELAPFIVGGVDGKTEFGRTGIPEVDLWIASVNPNKLRSRSQVYSPDRPTPRRTTWPCP